MFILQAEKNKLTMRQWEPLTSGSVNVYPVRFEFSEDWEGLERTAVFRAGDSRAKSWSVLLDESNACYIPWEALVRSGPHLWAGVCGTRGGEVVLPTIWADLGFIQSGATPGDEARPPTPDLWQQALAGKQDKLRGRPGQVVGFDADGRAVPQDSAGGGGVAWGVGYGLKVVGGDLAVDAVDDFAGDNTLPMTAAGVLASVGNIEALLGTI